MAPNMNFGHFWISDGVEVKPLANETIDYAEETLKQEYCVVTDSGLCYATYDDWIRKNFGCQFLCYTKLFFP